MAVLVSGAGIRIRPSWPILAALLTAVLPARAQSEASFPMGPESDAAPAQPGAARHDAARTPAAPPGRAPRALPAPAPVLAPSAPAPASSEPQELRLPPESTAASTEGGEMFVPVEPEGELSISAGGSSLPSRFWPSRLPYEEGDSVPPGYRVRDSAGSGLIIGGSTVLGVAYAASVVAAMGGSDGSGWLWLPVVGPFGSIMAQDVTCQAPPSGVTPTTSEATDSVADCSKKVVDTARRVTLLLVDGLVQVAGGSLLVVGLTTRHRELVREQALLLTPRVKRGSYGVEVWGQF